VTGFEVDPHQLESWSDEISGVNAALLNRRPKDLLALVVAAMPGSASAPAATDCGSAWEGAHDVTAAAVRGLAGEIEASANAYRASDVGGTAILRATVPVVPHG
jgi:hypothetical protein